MTETPDPSIYEKAFAESYNTDAILVIDGKKLHVNKALLSYHSDYFHVSLVDSNFEEKSIKEIEIKDVDFEDFATVLSLVHGAPIGSSSDYPRKYLDIAERFQLPAAKRHLELFLMINQRASFALTGSNQKSSLEMIEIADKYHLNDLMNVALSQLEREHYYSVYSCFEEKPDFKCFEQLSDETNIKLFHRFLEIGHRTFAKTYETDAVLVVDGKKLHVNKAVLSYHSDYFNVLFNSGFKEKSMKEIEIKDVDFENFATLLSMVHLNPIAPKSKQNAMKIVELSDRFIFPCAKPLLQSFIYSSPLSNLEKIRIGELYDDHGLFQEGINAMNYQDFRELLSNPTYQALSQKMTETEEPSVYEEAFAKSDKTDAILVVDGKKLHVNKALLSYHSDYFNVLFNSDFKERSMEEIEIKDVNFEDFATVLSLVHRIPIKYDDEQKYLEPLLELADRFQLPAVKRYFELSLTTSNHNWDILIEMADKYRLNGLMDITMSKYRQIEYCTATTNYKNRTIYKPKPFFEKLSDETNIKFFHHYLKINGSITEPKETETVQLSIYEETFAKSDKTDTILVVDGKEMHVNKAILSYHSDYFEKLFNSDFNEKSMEKFEIKDVNYEEFATLLSMIHLNPIASTRENALNILELSDRFMIPCAKYYLETSLISAQLASLEKIRIGEKYELSDLFQKGITTFNRADFKDLPSNPTYQALSSGTKKKLFYRSMEVFKF
ncbi:unnamed protein product [Caenorhabditis brenneri]